MEKPVETRSVRVGVYRFVVTQQESGVFLATCKPYKDQSLIYIGKGRSFNEAVGACVYAVHVQRDTMN
jgi:hypothetical protein